MDVYDTIFELIDMRSFSNLWFWIALAVVWSSASHWVLGVPYDMVLRARRGGSQAEEDLNDMVRINVNRILFIIEESGLWLAGFGCFILTLLALLGFVYGNEFSQAVFLLLFPMSFVGVLSIRTARVVRRDTLRDEPLRKKLRNHRLFVQFIGMLSILVTAMWGMFQNMATGPLGG